MITKNERLKKARIYAGFKSANAAANAHDWNVNSYKSSENGNSSFSFDTAVKYARAYGVNPVWLYYGTGNMKPTDSDARIKFYGYVQAGNETLTLDQSCSQIDEYFNLDIEPDFVCLKVLGQSMSPVYPEGSRIIFGRKTTADELINQEAFVKLISGEYMIKTIIKGNEKGKYTLISYNFPPIENVVIEEARPVKGMWKT